MILESLYFFTSLLLYYVCIYLPRIHAKRGDRSEAPAHTFSKVIYYLSFFTARLY